MLAGSDYARLMRAIALTIVVALAVCAMLTSVIDPVDLEQLGVGATAALLGGFGVLLVALPALWILQRRRDRTLR
jgi:hypothetical protein